jgi:hypothetical protein
MADKITPSSEEKKTLRARFSAKRANFKENHPIAHRVGTEVIAGAAYGAAIVGIVTLGLIAGSKLTDSDDPDEE